MPDRHLSVVPRDTSRRVFAIGMNDRASEHARLQRAYEDAVYRYEEMGRSDSDRIEMERRAVALRMWEGRL